MRKFIYLGSGLVLKVENISYANLTATKEGKPCIQITMSDGTIWSVYSDLKESRKILKNLSLETVDIFDKVKQVLKGKSTVSTSIINRKIEEILAEL